MELGELHELLLNLSYKDEDVETAHKAFATLYNKYSKTVCAVCKSMLGRYGIYNHELMETAIHNTFLKVYEKPNLNFNPSNGASVDSSFEAYLITILKHEILDLLKPKKKIVYLEEEAELSLVAEEEAELPQIESHATSLLNQVLNTFSERDRGILLAIFDYYEEGKNNPSDMLDWLASTYGTSRLNIRKIKERGLKKIKEYFSQHSTLKPQK